MFGKQGKSEAQYKQCVPPCKRFFVCRWYTQLVCALLGSKACGGGSRGGWLPALREPPSTCASLQKSPLLRGGFFHWRSSRRWPRFRWGGAKAALVGFAAGSGGGIGDERVSISILTCQISWPLSEIGSPPCGYFPRAAASALLVSSPEEVDTGSAEHFAPPLSPQYEELVEVITRAAAKLSLDWSAERPVEPQRGKLDERFLRFQTAPPHRSLPFFPDLHTEVSRSWGKPFSARLFVPLSDYYGNVAGTNERGYRAMPRVEQTLASYLSPHAASSLKAPTLPTKPLRTSSALVGKGYAAAGQAGSCLHTMAVLQAYQADLLKELDEGEGFSADDILSSAEPLICLSALPRRPPVPLGGLWQPW